MDQQRHKLFHKVGVCQDDKKERFYRQKKKWKHFFDIQTKINSKSEAKIQNS